MFTTCKFLLFLETNTIPSQTMKYHLVSFNISCYFKGTAQEKHTKPKLLQ